MPLKTYYWSSFWYFIINHFEHVSHCFIICLHCFNTLYTYGLEIHLLILAISCLYLANSSLSFSYSSINFNPLTFCSLISRFIVSYNNLSLGAFGKYFCIRYSRYLSNLSTICRCVILSFCLWFLNSLAIWAGNIIVFWSSIGVMVYNMVF